MSNTPAGLSERTLDWSPPPVLPLRTIDYPLEAAITTDVPWSYRYWRTGPILDQGSEGACVGHGVAGAVQAQPIDADLRDVQTAAFGLYRIAQYYDEWNGQAYEGTSVNAGLTVARMLGMIGEFRWPATIGELAEGIGTVGPAVIGVNMHHGQMYPDPEGWWHADGDVYGGHCVYVPGVNKVSRKFKIAQSWGVGHGVRGFVWSSFDTMETLMGEGGEAAILLAQPLTL